MAQSKFTQRIYMVTGKGGVGKSVVAAALARKLSSGGESKSLLVELGEQSYIEAATGQLIEAHKETKLNANLYATLWTGEGCLRDYIRFLLKVDRLADLFFDNKVMRTFLRAAPALKEISILGKITSGVRHVGPEFKYHSIVLDAYSTGHFLALIDSPKGLGELVDRGPMGTQTRDIQNLLKTPEVILPIIVTLPEDLPANEAVELHRRLKQTLGIDAPIICNKYLDIELGNDEVDQSRFSQFLQNKIAEQSRAINILNQETKKIHKLPFIFSANYEKIVTELEAAIGGNNDF